jgi:hypothetical protein
MRSAIDATAWPAPVREQLGLINIHRRFTPESIWKSISGFAAHTIFRAASRPTHPRCAPRWWRRPSGVPLNQMSSNVTPRHAHAPTPSAPPPPTCLDRPPRLVRGWRRGRWPRGTGERRSPVPGSNSPLPSRYLRWLRSQSHPWGEGFGAGGAIGRLQQKQRWPRPRFSPVGACRDAEMAKGR